MKDFEKMTEREFQNIGACISLSSAYIVDISYHKTIQDKLIPKRFKIKLKKGLSGGGK